MRAPHASAALLFALLALAAPSAARAERRIAVIAGNDSAGRLREPLRYAVRDARQVEAVLRGLGGVEQAWLLADETPSGLRATWSKVQAEVARDPAAATVFFYYSGHADERGLLMGAERYEFEELRRTLQSLHAKLFIAVIDACQAGTLARTKGGSAVPVLDLDLRASGSDHQGGVFMTAGSSGEAAQESDELGASFFTHYLVSGLRGAADDSGDRRVSLEEAYRFAYVHTLERTRGTLLGPQHPTYRVEVEGHGQLVLTWLATDRSYLVLPEAAEGRWFVKDRASGEVTAEVKKPAGSRLRIALDPGGYEVLRVEGDRAWAGDVNIGPRREVALELAALVPRALDRHAKKGADDATLSLTAAYRVATGWLEDAAPAHGVRVGAVEARDGGSLELGAFADYGESRYARRDAISVVLRIAGVGVSAAGTWPVGQEVRVLGGVEAGVAYAAQQGSRGGGSSDRRDALVVPLALRGGAELELVRGLALRVVGTAGVTVRDAADGLAAPLVAGVELGVRWAP